MSILTIKKSYADCRTQNHKLNKFTGKSSSNVLFMVKMHEFIVAREPYTTTSYFTPTGVGGVERLRFWLEKSSLASNTICGVKKPDSVLYGTERMFTTKNNTTFDLQQLLSC